MAGNNESDSFSRRRFLSLGRTALVFGAICSLYPVSRYLTFTNVPDNSVRIVKKDLLLSEKWQRINSTRFWLRHGNSGMEAIWATCTHLGCEVYFDIKAGEWLCPCHGSRYSDEGKPVQGPAARPLPRAPIIEKAEYIILKQPRIS